MPAARPRGNLFGTRERKGEHILERETKKILTIVGGVCASFVVVLVLVYCVGFLVARSYVRRGMTEEEIAAMERFFDEPVEIPKEWREVEPFTREVIEAGDRFRSDWSFLDQAENWEKWGTQYDKLQAGERMDDEDLKLVEQVVTDHVGVRKAIAELVSVTGYEFQAFPGGTPQSDLPNFLLAHVLAKEMALATYLEAERGDWDRAFEPPVIILRMTRRHAASYLITHLIALACQGFTTRCIGRVALACDDPEALTYLLEEMNRLDPEINLDVLAEAHMVDIVAELRMFMREGQQVDLTSKKPLRYFWWQVIECYGGQIDDRDSRQLTFLRAIPGASRMVEEILYRITVPNELEARTRELKAKATYDLARLTVAARLQELETGQFSQSAEDLAPRYFDEPLIDPFSEKPYLWHAGEKTFYSVGPDQTDDGCAVLYDASNGTISVGDISIRQ